MSQPTPWKLAVTGGFGLLAAIALLSRDWTIGELAALAGLALVARGTLHLETASFVVASCPPSSGAESPLHAVRRTHKNRVFVI